MEWAKMHDPVFGAGSYGHISCLVPAHLYVMHTHFDKLKNNGWKTLPEFAGFVKSVEGIPEMGKISNIGKEFFHRLPTVFLDKDKFEETFNEYTKKWRSAKTLPIIIAGEPRIAKAYLRWLFHSGGDTSSREGRGQGRGRGGRGRGGHGRGRGGRGGGRTEEQQPSQNVYQPQEDETIELTHHYMGESVKISINSCINWLIQRVATEEDK
jgi:hypothetical protein